MATKDKDKSLLEISVELLNIKHKPQQIMQIAKESMEIKGLKTAQAKELLPQFLADFMESGYFVYCGDGKWDLKERQTTAILDKDGSDYDVYDNVDEDVKENELKDSTYDEFISSNNSDETDDERDDEREEDEIATLLIEDENGETDGLTDVVVEQEEEEEEDDLDFE